jgi:hypothetical protein
MASLYYGNGNCSVEGDIRAIQINFTGAIEITDKTTDSFVVTAKNNKVIFYPLGAGILTDLFDYVGEFRIISVRAVDSNADFISVTVNQQNDYMQNINTNAEDATINIEDMDNTYTKDRIVSNTIVQPTKKPNQVLADNYLSGQLTQEALDDSVETTATPQVSSISTGTSY